uniref:Dihydropteroate synthase n=1 Tax=candidate division WOR-3 bacterium TaxID=2052148 RepID=A0A7C4UBN4_UNCW3
MVRIKRFYRNEDIIRELERIGTDKIIMEHISSKMRFYTFLIEGVSPAIGNIIKQSALSRGTDAGINRLVIKGEPSSSDILIGGTKKEFQYIYEMMKEQPFKIRNIFKEIMETIDFVEKKRRTKIMGILNVTPDSFYDGGRYNDLKAAIDRGIKMKEEGADIIDVGGESSRPGSEPVDEETEKSRVFPVIEALSKEGITISIDTYKSGVAEGAIKRGAKIVNDISGLRFDKNMIDVVKNNDVDVVIMHMKGTPKNMQENPYYEDTMKEIIDFLKERIEFAEGSGVNPQRIIIDPGIGFGKRVIDNIKIMKNIFEFNSLRKPILIGASRKSFIGKLTGADVNERLPGSLLSVFLSIDAGVEYVRVHDVKETKQVIELYYRIMEEDDTIHNN